MFSIYDGRECFWQWDSEQRLIVSDPTVTEVHFCNKTGDCSLVCEVYEEDGQRLVNVPNILLQTAWSIRAYAYCVNHTKQENACKVCARTKPDSYVYTETEIKRWETVEEEAKKVATETAKTEVAAAGQYYANAMQRQRAGAGFAIDDFSPIEHELNVHLQTVTVGSTLKVGGKNIFNYDVDGITTRGSSVEKIPGGYRWKKGGTYFINIPMSLPKGITIVASFEHNGTGTDEINNMRVEYASGTIKPIGTNGLTLAEDVKSIYIYKTSTGTGLTQDVDITNIQIELNTEATYYEPYTEPTVYRTTDETGVIRGIKSKGETISFLTDGSATATVSYNRDMNAVFNELMSAIISLGSNI